MINDLAPISVPPLALMSNLTCHDYTESYIIDQTMVSSLVVASVAHPEEILHSSPNAITQANMRYTKPEQNSSVNY